MRTRYRFTTSAAILALTIMALTVPAAAQPPGTSLESFGLKVFRVESGLYPFVQVYFRTFDQNMRPLVNLNELNIGVMVQGRSYDLGKKQYMVQSIANREEGVRTTFVLDASKTMRGEPFEAALRAAARFIDSKRPQDQVAIVAVNDSPSGYELVSNFERDPGQLARRLADVECDANTTRLYDAIAAAMQMSGMVSQGGIQTEDAQYIVSSSIVVFSDGKDEGSAISREDLMSRITNLAIPIPIYSLAYSRIDRDHLKNLEALSKNSFGIYYDVSESVDRMQRCVEDIQNILQNDYVVTFRSYLPVDGDKHNLKVGLEYPSRSGKMTYQSAEFEAIEPPPVERILTMQNQVAQYLKPLPDGNPYLSNPHLTQPEAVSQ